MMNKMARGFALFMNWFDGICAPVCGLWMMASALFALPVSWNDWMPISLIEPLPIPGFMKADFYWPGLALLLVNGLPNVIALVCRLRKNLRLSYAWGMTAGVLLILWTLFELAFMPNAISAFYLVLGILQLAASWMSWRTMPISEPPESNSSF